MQQHVMHGLSNPVISPATDDASAANLKKDDFEVKSSFLYFCALKSDIKLFLWVVGQKSGEAAKITTSPGFIIGPTSKSSCTMIPTPTYYHSQLLSLTFAGSIVSSSVEDCQNVITASEAWIGQLTPSLAPAAGHHHPVLTITLPLLSKYLILVGHLTSPTHLVPLHINIKPQPPHTYIPFLKMLCTSWFYLFSGAVLWWTGDFE